MAQPRVAGARQQGLRSWSPSADERDATSLILDGNQLEELPDSIWELAMLEVLDLPGNAQDHLFRHIPDTRPVVITGWWGAPHQTHDHDRHEWMNAGSGRQRGVRTQNSLPSGSARTAHGASPWPMSSGTAPNSISSSASAR